MRLSPRARARMLGISDQLNTTDRLKAAHRLVNTVARRDHRDNEALRLLLTFTLRPDSCCVDVGAHRGGVLRDIVRLAPAGRHIAFEPLPTLAAELASSFPAVDVHNAAVGAESGEVTFAHVVADPMLSSISDRGHSDAELEHITVKLEALDEALPEDFAPALIKVDVEGAELGVFQGAVDTLHRHRPLVAFEHGIGGADAFGTTPRDVHDLLVGELGYRIFDMDGTGPYDAMTFDAVFTQPIWNFVAVP
ncbi:FkbM family methyltransferase [Baekduia sp. Peel2402]|uniref:FkbM family methyltransferase n=1 Tax=Baekduia sp. Peel2402 TaxID=3458296 RepID=UPI00403ED14A